MRNHWLLSVALLALLLGAAGCSQAPDGTTPVSASSAPAAPAAPASNQVHMAPDVQKESGVTTMAVQSEAMPETVRTTARIVNDENHTWRVGAIAEGRITKVLANVGDRIAKDQVLALMHSHDIHESRALYKKAKADLARVQGVEDYAQRQRERAKRLYDLKAGSLAQVEEKDTELHNAQTDVRNAEVELERTRTHLEEVLGIPAEESDLPKAPAGEDNDLIPIRAPSAGIVLERNVTPGTVVNPATDLFLLSDLNTLWAIVEVKEEYLGKLRVGMPVQIFVQAYPGEAFSGRISRLGEVLNPTTRTIQVRVDLANSRGRLKPEMYADAEIQIGSGASAVMVPAEAVQDVRGLSAVFVKTGADTFELRPVTLGRTVDDNYQIVSGLKDGDVIAVHAAFVLKSEFLKAALSE